MIDKFWTKCWQLLNNQNAVRGENTVAIAIWGRMDNHERSAAMAEMFGPDWRNMVELNYKSVSTVEAVEGESIQMVDARDESMKFSNPKWEKLIKETFEHIQFLAKTKGEEYSGQIDRLRNFRKGAENLGLTKEQVLMVYASKHWDSIQTFVRERADSELVPRTLSEPMSGRVDDLIVYMLLFKAMLEESGL